jgi:NADH dehydrogenase
MEGRLQVDALALGATKLSEWIVRNRDRLGRHYTSELARRVDRFSQYRSN